MGPVQHQACREVTHSPKEPTFPPLPSFSLIPASCLKVLNILKMLGRALAISLEVRRKEQVHFLPLPVHTRPHGTLLQPNTHQLPDHGGRQQYPPPCQSSPILSSASPPQPLLREVTESTPTPRQCPTLKYLLTRPNKFHDCSNSFHGKCTAFAALTPLTRLTRGGFTPNRAGLARGGRR